jgi:putative acetyltransferase
MERIVSWALSRGIRRLFAEVSMTARPFLESMEFSVLVSQSIVRRGVVFENFRMSRDIDAEPTP